MINRLRQRRHRSLMKIIRGFNKNLEEDTLWRGRFKIYLLHDNFYEYEDGSGGELHYYIVMCDLKTGVCQLHYGDHHIDWFTRAHIFREVNDFIASISGVYNQAKNDSTDYTKVKFTPPSLRDFRRARGAYDGARLVWRLG